METNRTLRKFWLDLEKARQAALLLDYDGTLAPFTVVREQAFPYTGIPEMLTSIACDTRTRQVIITGRAIDDLLPLLNLEPRPEIWGCHGWERLDAEGKRTVFDLPENAAAGLKEARDILVKKGLESACEVKPASVALHWRGLDDGKIGQMQRLANQCWQPIVEEFGLELHRFNGGLELRPPGKDKGTAVNTILKTIDKGVPVAFLGDDQTDEDGFAAIKERGLAILVSRERRQTGAHLQISPPAGLINFFSTWHEKAPRKQTDYEEKE